MHHDDERDHAEEAANRLEMEMPECEGHWATPELMIYCNGSCRNRGMAAVLKLVDEGLITLA